MCTNIAYKEETYARTKNRKMYQKKKKELLRSTYIF